MASLESLHASSPSESYQVNVLEQIATGAPLAAILDQLSRVVEQVSPGARGCIQVLEPDQKTLRVAAAPSLPSAYSAAVDGLEMGPEVGSCGRAAYLGRPVVVSDIESDPLWSAFSELALGHGLRACWAIPILSPKKARRVVGTFAVYQDRPCSPDPGFLDWMGRIAHLASLALENEGKAQKLRDSEARFEFFADQSSDAILIHDEGGRVINANRRACENLQYSAHELTGKHLSDYDPGFTPERAQSILEKLQSGEELAFESTHRRRDGSTYPVAVRMRPVVLEGRFYGVSLIRDISERKTSEATLERQGLILSATQKFAGLGSFEWDLATNQVAWSDELFRIFGLDSKTFKVDLDSFVTRVHPDDRPLVMQKLESAIEDCSAFRMEERIIRPDGAIRVLESQGRVLVDEAGRPTRVVSACLDITERKKSEMALREGADSLRRAQKMACLQSWTYDIASGLFQVPADSAYNVIQWFGAPRTLPELLAAIHPDDRARVESAWEATLAGASYEVEHRMDCNGKIRWLRVCGDVLRDSEGVIEQIAGVTQDITSWRKLEEQLREAQKMEAVGRLAGGVAHDFNNLLTVINGYADLLLDSLPQEDCNRESIVAMRDAGQRGAELTAQLLAFSRRTIVEPGVFDLNKLVNKSATLIGRIIGEDVLVNTQFDSRPTEVKIDASQFEQILMNLAINARDAMPLGGRLSVSTGLVSFTTAQADLLELPGGDYVELKISDTGEGIPDSIKENIFEPFFTTKEEGKGTGLGLAVVHGVVKRAGGHIQVESQLGSGTTFRMLFPRVSQSKSPGKLLSAQAGQIP